MTVAEVNVAKLDPLVRKANKALMVAWINADLLNRAQHDVRKSVVLYDAHGCFVYALKELPDPELLVQLRERSVVRYWSKGI